MDIFESYAADEQLEVDGTWVDLDKDTKVLVARLENTEHTKLMMSVFEENESKLKDNPELDDVLTRDILAKTILRGWEGLSYKGRKLTYSIKNAAMVLGHKDFRKEVVRIATTFANYKAKLDQADVKK